MSNVPTHHIVQGTATGEVINGVVEKLESVLEGETRTNAIIALLSLTLVLMEPEISTELLQAGVQDISRYMCLYLEGSGDIATHAFTKEEMN